VRAGASATEQTESAEPEDLTTDAQLESVVQKPATIDEDHAGMTMWQDGAQIKDIIAPSSDADTSEGSIQPAGWSFNRFTSCLNVGDAVAAQRSLCRRVRRDGRHRHDQHLRRVRTHLRRADEA
jgi:hypothetical protein